ncbi:hypothetical protein [Atlantibacter hermannii]|uniref:hypothetical protein n=1 Tax=Atlantibacter hermannii TaxID=565 RepID=UPI0022B76D98|nr:hypothetical protein [Atlantibacter hermannii]MCZ7836070.1 hypothetical protein [Atlantibacter hermannii]
MREIGEQITAARAAAVIYETFGHLDAKPGDSHKGYFIFINGQHGDMDVVYSDFPTFGEGPGYFHDRGEFICEQTVGGGACAAIGIYRFDGEYRLPKRKGSARFVGKIICIQKFGEDQQQ